MTQQTPPPQPEPTRESLQQMGFSFAPSRILTAALQLRFFSQLAAGRETAADVARAAGASERGTAMLLDALVGLQLLTKAGGRYRLTPLSAQYLVRESPDYIGAMMEDDTLWESWSKLTDAVRTGKPPRRVEHQAEAERFFPILIRSLHIMNREPARRTAEALGAGTARHGLRVLDVACGSGVWGLAFAEADPQARLTFQDYPGVLEHTRGYLQRAGVLERCDFLPGDLKQVDFGTDRFDVALLGNIVHSEGEASSRDLLARLHRALKPGGVVVVIDMLPNEERTGPPFALIFALNMLVNTETGSTYTLSEYTRWLHDAGFRRVETADVGSHSPLVLGFKE